MSGLPITPPFPSAGHGGRTDDRRLSPAREICNFASWSKDHKPDRT